MLLLTLSTNKAKVTRAVLRRGFFPTFATMGCLLFVPLGVVAAGWGHGPLRWADLKSLAFVFWAVRGNNNTCRAAQNNGHLHLRKEELCDKQAFHWPSSILRDGPQHWRSATAPVVRLTRWWMHIALIFVKSMCGLRLEVEQREWVSSAHLLRSCKSAKGNSWDLI